MGAIGKPVPKGATYIYNVNFFAGFLVASGMYYILCRLSPIPACSERWMEVGDEIRNVSVAYGADGYEDDTSVSGDSGRFHTKGADDGGEAGVTERKVGNL